RSPTGPRRGAAAAGSAAPRSGRGPAAPGVPPAAEPAPGVRRVAPRGQRPPRPERRPGSRGYLDASTCQNATAVVGAGARGARRCGLRVGVVDWGPAGWVTEVTGVRRSRVGASAGATPNASTPMTAAPTAAPPPIATPTVRRRGTGP